jgi:hypothetical protein
MPPPTPNSGPEWITWALSPEHIVIAAVGAAIGLGALIALVIAFERLWRRAHQRLDDASEPATASRTDWWLCPVCSSLNRPSQACYKGCTTTDGQLLALRGDERPAGE